jgi:hypothetical protein
MVRRRDRRWNLSWAASRFALALVAAPVAAQTVPQPPPNLNPAERTADAVWTMRAGLNVAALQCQFSPFLMTVPTYNAFLRQHSDELGAAFKAMNGHFVRVRGPKVGPRAFDTYATRTNQSWATFDAQYSFCEAAAMVGRRALAVPKGQFGKFAEAEIGSLRESLSGNSRIALASPRLEYASVRPLEDPCPGRPPSRCR